ncbi:MAG TPA: hypothetical protein VFV71_03160 [Burkholderiales bacterium]|nr:hypothetical protein [Burkholderiales bacterium]
MALGRFRLFALIRSRQDAIDVVAGTAVTFLVAAVILGALNVVRGERTLLDAGLFAVLGVLLWRFRSPAAAIALLLVSVMRMFVTLAQVIDTGEVDWLHVAITVVVIFAAIRAAEATLKSIGRFAADGER